MPRRPFAGVGSGFVADRQGRTIPGSHAAGGGGAVTGGSGTSAEKAEVGGTLPAVLNAANEVAVEKFCNRRLGFTAIADCVRRVMDAHRVVAQPTLAQILEADTWARREAG